MNPTQIVIATVGSIFVFFVLVVAISDAYYKRKRKREEEERLAKMAAKTPPPQRSYQHPLLDRSPALPRMEKVRTNAPILMWRGYSDPRRGSYRGDWTSGYLNAECAGNQGFWFYTSDHHVAPNPYCTCGIYGYSKLHYQPEGYPYLALTAAYGNIIEHDAGYRAEHAQIVAYYVHDGYREDPWSYYGITRCRSIEKLQRVEDYYLKHPDELWKEIERLYLERMYHSEGNS